MRCTLSLLTLLLAVPALVAIARPAPVYGAPAATFVQSRELSLTELQTQFRQADDNGDFQRMGNLLRQNIFTAVFWVQLVATELAEEPTERRIKDMEGLKRGWRQTFQSGFVEQMERYHQLLRPEMRRARANLMPQYDRALTEYEEIRTTAPSDERTKRALHLSEIFEALGNAYLEVGDHLQASQSFVRAGFLLDETLLGAEARPRRALPLLKLGQEYRERIELRDPTYLQTAGRVSALEAELGPEETEPGAVDEIDESGLPGVSLGQAQVLEGTFVSYRYPAPFQRPAYAADEIYPAWFTLYLGADGSTRQFDAMGNDSPRIQRTGASAVVVVGSDAKEIPVPMTGNVEEIRTVIGQGEEQRPWSFLARLPTDREMYQGFEINFGPSREQIILNVSPSAGMRIDVAGTPVVILDDNLDGVYGGEPRSWGFAGVIENTFQWDVDSVLIGTARRSVPFSELMRIGDQWYRFEPVHKGRAFEVRPATVRTGNVRLEARGITFENLVVRGTGPLAGLFFDLAQAGRTGLDLPVGRYELLYGVVRSGRRQAIEKALVVGGAGVGNLNVNRGETTTLTLGAPFAFGFRHTFDEVNLSIPGDSWHVVGSAGERYVRLWNLPLRPEVMHRVAGTRRASRPERVPFVTDTQTLLDRGVQVSWFPLNLILEHRQGRDDLEVQAQERRHKLFGRIETDWR